MRHYVALFIFALPTPAFAAIELIAVAKIPGDAVDKSNLTDTLEDGTPHNRFGGFGSAIAHLAGNRYVVVADRGPKDGASRYQCRFHFADIVLKDGKLSFDLSQTVILRDPKNQPYLGDQMNLARRFDPEGVAVTSEGTVIISDEYGPKIVEFDRGGKQLRDFPIPDRFRLAVPGGKNADEAKSPRGRSPNRGFEGLTRTPGGKLVAALQGSLIQDGGFDGDLIRFLELGSKTLKTREFVYRRASPKTGVNEILALGEDDFLVLERDAKAGPKRFCKVFRVRLAGADDVSRVDRLSPDTTVRELQKTLFLDLADRIADLPPKVEGLCFGPNLADGRRLLLVITDNDFTDEPTFLYAFAVDAGDLR